MREKLNIMLEKIREKWNNAELYIMIFLMTAILIIWAFENYEITNINKEYPLLEDSIADIEYLIGDYSEFYVTVDIDKNSINHLINGTEAVENNIILLIPDKLSKKDIVVDFYTSWNEYLASYKCNFEENTYYSVHGKTISVESSELQFVFLDLPVEDLHRINESNKNGSPKEKAKALVTTSTPQLKCVKAEGRLQPRGNSSWNLYEKKPYSLKFEGNTDFFGLGAGKKWNLLASASDKTLLKDIMFFKLAKDLELKYSPNIKLVNMYINGFYEGVYCITPKVDVSKNSVNLNNGDFLINWGSPNCKHPIDFDCDFWMDNADLETNPTMRDSSYVELVWPDGDKTNDNYNNIVHNIIQDYVDILEFRKEGKLSDYIDIESFAKYYWVEEISMNADGFSRSFYTYYKASTGKLYAGPVWDMEWTLGANINKADLIFNEPEGWKLNTQGMFNSLLKHKEFADEVNRIYKEYNISTLMNRNWAEYKEASKQISVEGNINFELTKNNYNYFDFEYNDVNCYEDFVNKKLEFYNRRIVWIEHEMNIRGCAI